MPANRQNVDQPEPGAPGWPVAEDRDEPEPLPGVTQESYDEAAAARGDDTSTSDSDSGTGEVPEHAADVVAWIKDAEDDQAEAQRRAQAAWDVESQREGGTRTTVETEVDRWLQDDDSK